MPQMALQTQNPQPQVPATLKRGSGAVSHGLDINPVITHRFPADDFQKAFQIMEEGNCGKIILDWE